MQNNHTHYAKQPHTQKFKLLSHEKVSTNL